MGIKDLSQYIRKNTDAYKEKSISEFRGKKIAVDISVFLYKTIRSQGEENWMMPMVSMLYTLKKYAIKIVCVFDGPNVPQEKLKERDERKSSTQKVKDKLETVENMIKIVENCIEKNLDLTIEQRTQIKDIVSKQRNKDKFDAFDYRSTTGALKILQMTREKFAKQCIGINQGHAEKVKEIVRYLGMAVMQADGEAETLCCYMCIKGMVDAVLTEDTDVLAYGVPVFLSKFDNRNETFMQIDYQDLIDQMDMTSNQFQDFCIMCSCDYNDRIKLIPKKPTSKPTGIGPAKAYKLLQEHGTLDEIEYATDLDLSPLIYERCRVLFTLPKIYDGLVLPYNKAMNEKKVKEFLTRHKCGFLFDKIKDAWLPTPVVIEGEKTDNFKVVPKKVIHHTDKYVRLAPKNKADVKIDNSLNIEEPLVIDAVKIEKKKKISEPAHKKLAPKNTSTKILDPQITTIYSDGSCLGNPGPGGWAFVVVEGDKKPKIICGKGEKSTTNNRMELMAVLRALEYINKKAFIKVQFYTDSKVSMQVVKKIQRGGDYSENKNLDLLKKIDDEFYSQTQINFEWVKAHEDSKYNNLADKYARQKAEEVKKE